MQRLETSVSPMIKSKMWIRCVDDIFVIIKKNKLENAKNIFEGMKFTFGAESDNKLPFYDVLITRTNTGKLETRVYREPTHTDQILNNNSNNPTTHKINCVKTPFQRTKIHCYTLTTRRNRKGYLMTAF